MQTYMSQRCQSNSRPSFLCCSSPLFVYKSISHLPCYSLLSPAPNCSHLLCMLVENFVDQMETTADAIAFSANTARLGLGGETLSRTFSSEIRLNTVAGEYELF